MYCKCTRYMIEKHVHNQNTPVYIYIYVRFEFLKNKLKRWVIKKKKKSIENTLITNKNH